MTLTISASLIMTRLIGALSHKLGGYSLLLLTIQQRYFSFNEVKSAFNQVTRAFNEVKSEFNEMT
jgi:hypothetical protein